MGTSVIIVPVAVVFGICRMVFADIRTFQPGSGSWHNENNWSPTGVPTAADRAIIPSGKICNIESDDAIADTIVVESTGWLRIHPDRTLTLENDTQNSKIPDDSNIEGLVELLINGTNPPTAGGAIAFTEADHGLLGEGTIKGQYHAVCKITIEAGIEVTNYLAEADNGIRGALTIEGLTGGTNGLFNNEGLVEAAGKGTIVLASTTILEDIEGALWSIGHCQSDMVFNRQTLDLEGDVRGYPGSGGRLEFNQNIKTCGTFTRNCCIIDVASGKTFSYVGFVDGIGSCGNPGTPGADPVTCTDPYVIAADADPNITCEDP